MDSQDFASRAEFIAQVAYEASEEPDAIEQHPEIVDMLRDMAADKHGLHKAFGANGHDPVAFVEALADGLEIYRTEPLERAPGLIDGLSLVASTLHQSGNGVAHA